MLHWVDTDGVAAETGQNAQPTVVNTASIRRTTDAMMRRGLTQTLEITGYGCT